MDISGVSAAGGMHAVSGASSSGPPQQKMSDLFDSIDSSGSGSITQSQFDQAFQTKNPPAVFQKQGADAIFAALDPGGTGSVSKPDFVSGMKKLMASLRADNAGHVRIAILACREPAIPQPDRSGVRTAECGARLPDRPQGLIGSGSVPLHRP